MKMINPVSSFLHNVKILIDIITGIRDINQKNKELICKQMDLSYEEFKKIEGEYYSFIKKLKEDFTKAGTINEIEDVLKYTKETRREIVVTRNRANAILEGFIDKKLEKLENKDLHNALDKFKDNILNYFKVSQNGNNEDIFVEPTTTGMFLIKKIEDGFIKYSKENIIEDFERELKELDKKSESVALSYGRLKGICS